MEDGLRDIGGWACETCCRLGAFSKAGGNRSVRLRQRALGAGAQGRLFGASDLTKLRRNHVFFVLPCERAGGQKPMGSLCARAHGQVPPQRLLLVNTRSLSRSQWETIYVCKIHKITKIPIGIRSVNLREHSLGAETVRGLSVQTVQYTGAHYRDGRKRGITVTARYALRAITHTTHSYKRGARHSGTRLKGTLHTHCTL
ncbi:hypothetical protein EVAR_12619_1 [Eumeta japonica]|uniref:Uncharacterized protein n=1 Tax=Eumeta variegata TaxID=151549 RepID=A0A4C1UG45_EUMVA|nr:hypothetical protein EVAR_12619_1 [Eumeta japonica]